MARLTINSYQGDTFNIWFNDEITGKKYFDASEWAKASSGTLAQLGYTEAQGADAWSISNKAIRFSASNVPHTIISNGIETVEYDDIYAEWRGKFKTKGDRIIGGKVTNFDRSWGRSYGNIDISNINYNLKKEMGTFWSLTLPNEITNHFNGTIGEPQYDAYGGIVNSVSSYLSALPPGSTYDFSTPYG